MMVALDDLLVNIVTSGGGEKSRRGTISSITNIYLQELLEQVSTATQRVMPRIDDLVRTMYMCTRHNNTQSSSSSSMIILLEARASALVMTCSSLVAIVRASAAVNVGTTSVKLSTADRKLLTSTLADMDVCAAELRSAAEIEEQCEKVDILLDSAPNEADELVLEERAPSGDECPADPAVSSTSIVVDGDDDRSIGVSQ